MNGRNGFAAGLLAAGLLLGVAGGGLAEARHSHEGQAHSGLELTLDEGRKWPTDEILRSGMSEMRDDMAASLPRIHAGQFSDGDYATLAGRLEGRIDHVVANCALPPEADAQLHLVLAEMLDAVDAMKRGPDAGAALRIIQGLDAYGRHFDHPGWPATRQ